MSGPDAHRWVSSASEFESVVDSLLSADEYAIDTEFHREKTYYPQLALVQLAWDDELVLVDPFAVDPSGFARLFESDVLAVFHAADQDLEVLEYAAGATPRRMWDTQIAGGFVGFSSASLVTLADRVLGLRLSKGDRLTDWTRRPLSAAQRVYAASDVAHLLQLKATLLEQLEASGRTAWVDDEVETLRLRPRAQIQGPRAWWKLKDGRVLRGKDRLVAQELCIWREIRARSEDKPVRFVLPDLVVIGIAQSRPKRPEELASIRGMDGRYSKGGAGAEILNAVERSFELTNADLVVPEADDFDRRLRPALTLLSAWVAQLAKDAKLDPALLATRSDLVELLRGDDDAKLARGWRRDVLGDAIRSLVSGDAALAFERSGVLRLEERSRLPLGTPIRVPDVGWADTVQTAEFDQD